jgi:ABC-type branched-subunit amino acid transport system ATPase component
MLLRVEKVTKAFDGFVAVQDVDLSVIQGQMACIIGPNGAG